jgi:fatty acid desaturase
MATYLDNRQRAELAHAARHWLWRSELPTWLLIVAVYASWFGVAVNANRIGLPLACVLLTLATTWFLSLQHELLHGHPTRLPWLNALLGAAPLGIWLPYRIYRRSHLEHHAADLTHPDGDPESYFLYAGDWHAAGPLVRRLYAARNTLTGRVLLQPAFAIASIGADAVGRVRHGNWEDVPTWIAHLLALGVLLVWLDTSCGMPAWLVLAGVGYPALSLAAIRSFHEHRVDPPFGARSVINDAGWAWRLLFLNNNYHLVHHDLPAVPWFALAWVYRRRAGDYLARTDGFLVRGYREWIFRYALRAVAPVAHPVYHAPAERPRDAGGHHERT